MYSIDSFKRCLDALDLALAAFYEIDLLPNQRREIDALTIFYSLVRKSFNEFLKSLAK